MESNAILCYLAAKSGDRTLWPPDPKSQADVIRWLSWEGAHWAQACGVLVYERVVKGMLLGLGGPDPTAVEKGEQEFHRFAAVLNGHLKGHKWLTGANLTVADFSVGAAMAMAEPGQYPMANYTEISRWYGTLAAMPAWRSALIPIPTPT